MYDEDRSIASLRYVGCEIQYVAPAIEVFVIKIVVISRITEDSVVIVIIRRGTGRHHSIRRKILAYQARVKCVQGACGWTAMVVRVTGPTWTGPFVDSTSSGTKILGTQLPRISVNTTMGSDWLFIALRILLMCLTLSPAASLEHAR